MNHLVDYHIHTNFSDGKFSPEEIVDRYIKDGYNEIAITDHDTFEGSKVAVSYAKNKCITVIPGIEISTCDSCGNQIHILGYAFDFCNHLLADAVDNMKQWRVDRALKIHRLLEEKGYDINLQDVFRVDNRKFIGRPTFAEILYKKGAFNTKKAAMNYIFSDKDISSVKRKSFSVEQAIDIIHSAGGKAVFAHPMEVKKKTERYEDFYPRLLEILQDAIKDGIDGIECIHPSANYEESIMLSSYAKKNRLIITRGSDFHTDEERSHYVR